MQEQSVYQKSMRLCDSDSLHKQLLMSCIIYASEYYPFANQWLSGITSKCVQTANGQQQLMEAIQQLINDFNRQLIYGPTAMFVTAHDVPHFDYLNSHFIREESPLIFTLSIPQLAIAKTELGLDQFISNDQIQQLIWYRRSYFMSLGKFIAKTVAKEVLCELEVNGESWSMCNPLPTLLLTLKNQLQLVKQTKNTVNRIASLLLARLAFSHNKIIQNPTQILANQALSNYRDYIASINKLQSIDILHYVSLLLQYAHVLVFYYKYSQCQKVLELCKVVSQLQLEFTGKLGRRTKFQAFDTPQLVLNIKQKQKISEMAVKQKNDEEDEVDKQTVDISNAKQLIFKQIESSVSGTKSQIDAANFDDESILLDKPKFVEEQTQQKKAGLHQLLVTLASIQYIWETTPKDQMLYQQVSAYLSELLEYKQKNFSYPIMFNILMLRSLNQFPRTKNVERSLDQLQKLASNFNSKTDKDIKFLYSTSYVTNPQFTKIMAHKYIEIGMGMTAIQLYQKLGMYEDCMDGLVAKNYKEKALALANKYQQENGLTPRLLCIFGDLHQGEKSLQYYKQAWELSGMRNARSQRSIGWHYYAKKQYQNAADAFKKATQANFYHPNTWFTLGCCYMQLKNFPKAVSAFGESVCIDQTQGQAWGNIATCYIYQNRLKQAYSTLQQALKHSQKNWKLWANMMTVSLKLKKFYKYFQCVEKLVSQEKSQVLNAQILSKLVTIFKYQQDTSERRRPIKAMKNRLDRLYTYLVQKQGQSPIIWKSIFQYNCELEQYVIQNYKHYVRLHTQNKIDANDLLQGYQTQQKTKQTSTQQLIEVKESILNSKQTQLNMTMKVGWDSDKRISESVALVLQEYVEIFQKYAKRDEKTIAEFKLFIKGVRTKLQKCLQKQICIKSTLI